jgi:protein-disulfide isomerase-like protein with CxxC motif
MREEEPGPGGGQRHTELRQLPAAAALDHRRGRSGFRRPAPALQQRFGIASIPTLMVFRNGQVAASQIGAAPADQLRTWLNRALEGAAGS